MDVIAFATLIVVTYLFVVPALVFVHELAHAAAGLALLPGPVRITIGPEPRWEVTVGRLEIGIDPAGWRTWWPGYYHVEATPTGYRGAAISLIGPVSSLATAGALVATASTSSGALETVCLGGASWALLQGVLTAVPITYPDWMTAYAGLDSDGKRAIRYLRA